MILSDLTKVLNRQSRSICPENPTGEPGKGGSMPVAMGSAGFAAQELGCGWKVNPYCVVEAGCTLEMASILGMGCITHIWLTPTGKWRDCILRFYWDDQKNPSVECPLGDFFCMGWEKYAQISSLAVCVNPANGFNCYWNMPFRSACRITMENRSTAAMKLYYQIDYHLCDVPQDAVYFHAQFRRVNPLPYKEVYTILDNVSGRGHYVGTYLAWGVHNNGWWGEGEIKFYLDQDEVYPTICGTGTEDYFCGSYDFIDPASKACYLPFTTPYSGLAQVIEPDRMYHSQFRFGMYRWHLSDPICFDEKLRVTIQALAFREDKRYLPLQDDISSVAFWYQQLPTADFPALPCKDFLEII